MLPFGLVSKKAAQLNIVGPAAEVAVTRAVLRFTSRRLRSVAAAVPSIRSNKGALGAISESCIVTGRIPEMCLSCWRTLQMLTQVPVWIVSYACQAYTGPMCAARSP